MFDTYVKRTSVVSGPKYPQEVHEYRAPTDDSIRILNEMTTKAMKNLISTFEVDDNYLKCVMGVFKDDYGLRFRVIGYFTLNDHKYDIDYTLKEEPDKERLSQLLIANLEKAVAHALKHELLHQLVKGGLFGRKGIGS